MVSGEIISRTAKIRAAARPGWCESVEPIGARMTDISGDGIVEQQSRCPAYHLMRRFGAKEIDA